MIEVGKWRVHRVSTHQVSKPVTLQDGSPATALVDMTEVELSENEDGHSGITLRAHSSGQRQRFVDAFREGEFVSVSVGSSIATVLPVGVVGTAAAPAAE